MQHISTHLPDPNNVGPDVETDVELLDPLQHVRDNLGELRTLHNRKSLADGAFNDAIDTVAEAAEMRPAILKRYVKAMCKGDDGRLREDTNQLSLLLGPGPEDTEEDDREAA